MPTLQRIPASGNTPYSQRSPGHAFGLRQTGRPTGVRTRRYDISYLGRNGDVIEVNRIAPSIPIFEDAFSAFARGTLVATNNGPVAVEDLLPGDRIQTRDNGLQTLQWVGSMMLAPAALHRETRQKKLCRITADAFGLGRPAPDLILGPGARLLRRDAALVGAMGTPSALAPVKAFADGEIVLEVKPVTAVKVYHLAFARHQIICANGLETESYHPGPVERLQIDHEMKTIFMALFPHIRLLRDFGELSYPRLSLETAQEILAA
ncbi:MAG TPA: Hint domain-containing protein [Rhodobacteraceae bacterium]|nr:Hint domain-containing protein [Paracoccaceae bacterium]